MSADVKPNKRVNIQKASVVVAKDTVGGAVGTETDGGMTKKREGLMKMRRIHKHLLTAG